MEIDVLLGAREIIKSSRPLIWVEILKTDSQRIKDILSEYDYHFFAAGQNMLAVPGGDSELLSRFWVNEQNVLFVNV